MNGVNDSTAQIAHVCQRPKCHENIMLCLRDKVPKKWLWIGFTTLIGLLFVVGGWARESINHTNEQQNALIKEAQESRKSIEDAINETLRSQSRMEAVIDSLADDMKEIKGDVRKLEETQ